MSDTAPSRAGGPRAGVALAFAVAALAASWSPIAAPLGLITGIGATIFAARSLRVRGRKLVPAAALALAILAVLASTAVLLLTAGAVGTELAGERVVAGRSRVELDRVLAEAAERTSADRGRAARQLEGQPEARPLDGGPGQSRGSRASTEPRDH